jgi:hypothetical protein
MEYLLNKYTYCKIMSISFNRFIKKRLTKSRWSLPVRAKGSDMGASRSRMGEVRTEGSNMGAPCRRTGDSEVIENFEIF